MLSTREDVRCWSERQSAMATPDYLDQAILPGRSWTVTDGSPSVRSGAFHRPSVNSLIWAVLDATTVAIATLVALRVRVASAQRDACHLAACLPAAYRVAVPAGFCRVVWGAADCDRAVLRAVRTHSEPQRAARAAPDGAGDADLRASAVRHAVSGARRDGLADRGCADGDLHHGASVHAGAPSGARWCTGAIARGWRRAMY